MVNKTVEEKLLVPQEDDGLAYPGEQTSEKKSSWIYRGKQAIITSQLAITLNKNLKRTSEEEGHAEVTRDKADPESLVVPCTTAYVSQGDSWLLHMQTE